MKESRLRPWDEIINEIQSENPFQSWSKQKKCGLKIGVVLIFCCLAMAPISVLAELIEKSLLREYESMFRLLAQLSVGTITLMFAVVFVRTFREFCHFEHALKETSDFAASYSPKLATKKLRDGQRSVQIFMRISGLLFYGTMLGWFVYPIYSYWSMYPHVDYSQLHLFFGDHDFCLERSQYFWYLQGVSFISATFITTVTLLHYALPIRAFILIETQVHILIGSLRATAAALNHQAMSHRVQFKLSATDHDVKDRHVWLRNSKWITSLEAFPLRIKEASENAHPSTFLVSLEDHQNTGSVALRYCIIHHQKILRLLRQLKHLLAPVLCLKVFSSIVAFTNTIVIIASQGSHGQTILSENYVQQNEPIQLRGGGTHMPKLLLCVTSAAFLINLVLSILYLTRLRDACRGVSDAAFELVRFRHIPRKDLFIIINRSLKEETFPSILTSALSFKDLYRLVDFSLNYFIIAEAMARKRPENSS